MSGAPRFRAPWVILNPQAASGKARRAWPRLAPLVKEVLGAFRLRRTRGPGHATELARDALNEGADLVVVVGGDGTVNEAVNGFLQEGEAAAQDAALALCPLGTGGDFRRGAGIPATPVQAIQAIVQRPTRRIDAAWVRLLSREGEPVERFFLNVASFGLGGEVSVAAKTTPLARYSGRAAFLWATTVCFLRYRAKAVRMVLDRREPPQQVRIMQVALGNGSFHGGGMEVCPRAALDSGVLDLTVVEETGFFDFLRSVPLLYSGRVYTHRKCRHYRVRHLSASSVEPVAVEVDGEALGTLPLEARIVPGAIRLAGIRPRAEEPQGRNPTADSSPSSGRVVPPDA